MTNEQTKEIETREIKQLAVADISEVTIKNLIYVIRGQQVMLDSDLAMLYQVETKVFNQAVADICHMYSLNKELLCFRRYCEVKWLYKSV